MLKVFHESVPSERNTNLRKKITQKSYHMFLIDFLVQIFVFVTY